MTDTASNGGRKMVTGIFSNGASVERADEAATGFGYDKGDINVVMSDETRKRYVSEDRPIDTDLTRRAAEGPEGRTDQHPDSDPGRCRHDRSALGHRSCGRRTDGCDNRRRRSHRTLDRADWRARGLGKSGGGLRHYEAEIHDGGILVGVKTRSAGDARRLVEQWLAIGGQHVDA